MKTDNEPLRAISPEIQLLLEPEVKYILAVETSATMVNMEMWKWVNKAVQKFIRYDLPINTEVGVVSFNNVSKVENKLELLTSESKERIADTVPGKYQLSTSDHRLPLCQLFKKDSAPLYNPLAFKQ